MVFDQRSFLHPKIKKIGRLLIPRIFGSSVYLINVYIISRVLASMEWIVGKGAIAALYLASRIWQFPLAIFAIALAQAALPTLSGHIATKRPNDFRNAIGFLLRAVCFVLIPASAGLIALAVPITKTLFERGAFGAYSTQITSFVLLFYSFGLLSYGVIKILVNGFYSMQDTKTPVKIAAVSLVVNIILSVLLMFPLKVAGLALANSIAGIFNATILLIILRKRIGGFGKKKLVTSFLRILVASLLMGIFAFWFNGFLNSTFVPVSTICSIINLAVTIVASILLYIAACYILQVKELEEVKQWLSRKR